MVDAGARDQLLDIFKEGGAHEPTVRALEDPLSFAAGVPLQHTTMPQEVFQHERGFYRLIAFDPDVKAFVCDLVHLEPNGRVHECVMINSLGARYFGHMSRMTNQLQLVLANPHPIGQRFAYRSRTLLLQGPATGVSDWASGFMLRSTNHNNKPSAPKAILIRIPPKLSVPVNPAQLRQKLTPLTDSLRSKFAKLSLIGPISEDDEQYSIVREELCDDHGDPIPPAVLE